MADVFWAAITNTPLEEVGNEFAGSTFWKH